MNKRIFWERIIGVIGIAFLCFAVVQMALEAFYDIWLFTGILGFDAAQICLLFGLLFITIYLFILYFRKRNTVILILFCILLAITLFEMFAFVNISIIMRLAPV